MYLIYKYIVSVLLKMMKLLSIVALTSGVTSVTAATTTTSNQNTKEQKHQQQQQQQLVGSSITPNRKLDTITTHQLQKDTNQFVQDNINSIRFIHSNKDDEDITNNNNEVVQQGDEEQNNRALRSRKFRQKKNQFGGEYWHSPSWDEWGSEWGSEWGGPGKSGKSGAPSWGKKWSGKSDKSWHASWDDVGWHSDSWSGSRSGKGGFLSRDKWDDKWDNSGGDWSHSRSWDFDFDGRDEVSFRCFLLRTYSLKVRLFFGHHLIPSIVVFFFLILYFLYSFIFQVVLHAPSGMSKQLCQFPPLR